MTHDAPLSGVRVLDLSRILAAPLTAQLLGDLGADVIKVERPGGGDDSRSYGPPFLHDADGNPTTEAGFYLSANRNKRSITVDHSVPEGAEVIRALARRSDVLIENFRAGVLEKYGLDYETLHQLNPGLVYCSITGYGQDGPYADRPGYDGVFQAMSGMMSVSGIPDGEPGAGPMKVGISMIDILTGLYAGNAILAALRHREVAGGVRTAHRPLAAGLRRRIALPLRAELPRLGRGCAPARQRRLRRHPLADLRVRRRRGDLPRRQHAQAVGGRGQGHRPSRARVRRTVRHGVGPDRPPGPRAAHPGRGVPYQVRERLDPRARGGRRPGQPGERPRRRVREPAGAAPRSARDGRPPGLGSGRRPPQPDPVVRHAHRGLPHAPDAGPAHRRGPHGACWAWGTTRSPCSSEPARSSSQERTSTRVVLESPIMYFSTLLRCLRQWA